MILVFKPPLPTLPTHLPTYFKTVTYMDSQVENELIEEIRNLYII